METYWKVFGLEMEIETKGMPSIGIIHAWTIHLIFRITDFFFSEADSFDSSDQHLVSAEVKKAWSFIFSYSA